MKERIITAIALVTVFGISLFLGETALKVLVTALLLIASYEVYLSRKGKVAPIVLLPYALFVLASMFIPLDAYLVYLSGMILVFFGMAVIFPWYKLDEMAYSYLMISVLITTAVGFREIISIDLSLLIFVMIAAFATDIFAFFGGMKFGKNKLIPRLSPNKTVEGAVSGYIAGVVFSLIFGYFFVQTHVDLIPIAIASLVIPIFSQIGDLSFSLVKRRFNIKDFGYIFPGHGGVLDRIDSLIFAIMTLNIVLSLLA